jgi:hypothetical protein
LEKLLTSFEDLLTLLGHQKLKKNKNHPSVVKWVRNFFFSDIEIVPYRSMRWNNTIMTVRLGVVGDELALMHSRCGPQRD